MTRNWTEDKTDDTQLSKKGQSSSIELSFKLVMMKQAYIALMMVGGLESSSRFTVSDKCMCSKCMGLCHKLNVSLSPWTGGKFQNWQTKEHHEFEFDGGGWSGFRWWSNYSGRREYEWSPV